MSASEDSARIPPEVDLTMLEIKNLPKKTEPWENVRLPIDILLLTVEDCEILSCLSHLNRGFCRSYCDAVGPVYFGDIGEDETTKLKVAVIQCKPGSAVPNGSVVEVPKAVRILRPKAVFCVGFCGGLNKNKVKLGDVVISAKLITYAPSKFTKSGVLDRGVRVPLKPKLATLIKCAGHGWEAPLKGSRNLEVNVHRDGVFLTGPEVVDSNTRRDQLIERASDAIAIEMEGEGLYVAAHDLDVEWVVIKGVSDFADGNKSDTDEWRPFASKMAASLTAHILKDSILFKDWPHYKDTSGPKRRISSTEDLDGPTTPTGTKSAKTSPGSSVQNYAVKTGNPTDDELVDLSKQIGNNWKPLASRLEFTRAETTAFHKENEKYAEKAEAMLLKWQEKKGEDATYQALYDALCHKFVGNKALAEKFCCFKK